MGYYFRVFKKRSFLALILALIIATAILPACYFSGKTSQNTAPDSTVTASLGNTGDWVSLFDGKTFAGWHTYGKNSVGTSWKAEDSAMHLISLVKSGWQTKNGGDLVSNEEYTNFDLMVEWKISEGGNSGIFIYVDEYTTRYKNPNQSGLEMQLNDDENNKNGTIALQRSGDLVGLLSASAINNLKPAGQWNLSEIRCEGGKLHFFINRQNILATVLWDDSWKNLIEKSRFKNIDGYGTYRKGRIALQDHGGDVWFRNIRIRKI